LFIQSILIEGRTLLGFPRA